MVANSDILGFVVHPVLFLLFKAPLVAHNTESEERRIPHCFPNVVVLIQIVRSIRGGARNQDLKLRGEGGVPSAERG